MLPASTLAGLPNLQTAERFTPCSLQPRTCTARTFINFVRIDLAAGGPPLAIRSCAVERTVPQTNVLLQETTGRPGLSTCGRHNSSAHSAINHEVGRSIVARVAATLRVVREEAAPSAITVDGAREPQHVQQPRSGQWRGVARAVLEDMLHSAHRPSRRSRSSRQGWVGSRRLPVAELADGRSCRRSADDGSSSVNNNAFISSFRSSFKSGR